MTGTRGSRLSWYSRRLSRMSPVEMAWRVRDKVFQAAWLARRSRGDRLGPSRRLARLTVSESLRFTAVLPADTVARVPEAARSAVLACADRLLAGGWKVLGVARTDLDAPDWFFDPVTGRRAPADRYAFRINHRSEEVTGNIKQIWEISRLHHLTLLATAWFLSGDEAYARRVDEQLRSWWRHNPFLSGVNWTSGIEVGIRLISMVWIRRLLDAWPPVTGLFEENEVALAQIRCHQQYLATFTSRGSSANNHVIAEAAGHLVASCAFPWFKRSAAWRVKSARLLERELARNTFPSGIDRELASDYQSLVAELGLLAAVECEAAGHPLGPATWKRLSAMVDSGAAVLDVRLRPPRQGDGDEGRALVLDPPAASPWPSLLSVGAALFGPLGWWPQTAPDAATALIGAMQARHAEIAGRPQTRPWRFADAGMTLLRTTGERDPEIWCRCDGGPHGFGSIAAHAHADALSVEVRYGGLDVLADPGTYCYHGEPAWRSYFRSTIAHNTVEVAGRSQSEEGGPFLWLKHAKAREVAVLDIGDAAEWTAEHDGYLSPEHPARHRRCVRLDRATRSIDIVDDITGGSFDVRLAFHFGPEVAVELDQEYAILSWPGESAPGLARLELPWSLTWSLHKGETDPILGWYSSGFGQLTPAVTLIGCGRSESTRPFMSRLEFYDVGTAAIGLSANSAVSWLRSNVMAADISDVRAGTHE